MNILIRALKKKNKPSLVDMMIVVTVENVTSDCKRLESDDKIR